MAPLGVCGRGCLEVRRLGGPAHAHAHPVLFDRDLAHPRLLDDPDHLANSLLPRLVDTAGGQRLVAARALADRTQQRLRLLTEEREQQQLFLARREPVGVLPQRVQIDRRLGLAAEVLDGASECGIDRSRASGRSAR